MGGASAASAPAAACGVPGQRRRGRRGEAGGGMVLALHVVRCGLRGVRGVGGSLRSLVGFRRRGSSRALRGRTIRTGREGVRRWGVRQGREVRLARVGRPELACTAAPTGLLPWGGVTGSGCACTLPEAESRASRAVGLSVLGLVCARAQAHGLVTGCPGVSGG